MSILMALPVGSSVPTQALPLSPHFIFPSSASIVALLQECFGGGGGRLSRGQPSSVAPGLGGTFSPVTSGASVVFGEAQQIRTPDLRKIEILWTTFLDHIGFHIPYSPQIRSYLAAFFGVSDHRPK